VRKKTDGRKTRWQRQKAMAELATAERMVTAAAPRNGRAQDIPFEDLLETLRAIHERRTEEPLPVVVAHLQYRFVRSLFGL
jgi:hypothetical protein